MADMIFKGVRATTPETPINNFNHYEPDENPHCKVFEKAEHKPLPEVLTKQIYGRLDEIDAELKVLKAQIQIKEVEYKSLARYLTMGGADE